MIKTERVADAGFESDYARYVELRANVEAEVKAEFEKVLADRVAKYDQLIALTSHEVEIEVPDEEIVEETTTETHESY